MNTDNNTYNPADDDNQGVVQVLAQSEASNTGIPQNGPLSPITASGPEPEKAEVADLDSDSGVNDDLLAEETVEEGDVEIENEK
ncbi:hypothetical protein [Spirosoma aerolatum]|uniref:hypothetical protein n=1 Tax=Spirosoma aerolatum TaxID=1211326 RepID=UPI0009AC5B79|nr:hypothetical protein [Spirosoma aerolatum]